MSDREAFEKWWPSVGQTIGKVAAWEAWQAALQHAGSEPVAVADRGVLNWIDGKQFNREADLYTHPQPVVPPQWKVVMRGMVEYAECNDPGNPYLDQAKALLLAGKGE
jgi:hypothetical protein